MNFLNYKRVGQSGLLVDGRRYTAWQGGRVASRVAEGGGVDQRVILLTASCYLMSSLAAETWTTIKERMIEFSQEICGSFVVVPDILAWRYPKLTEQRDSELETSFLEHGSHSLNEIFPLFCPFQVHLRQIAGDATLVDLNFHIFRSRYFV